MSTLPIGASALPKPCPAAFQLGSNETSPRVEFFFDPNTYLYPGASSNQIQTRAIQAVSQIVTDLQALPWPRELTVYVNDRSINMGGGLGGVIIAHDLSLSTSLPTNTIYAADSLGFIAHELGHVIFANRLLEKLGRTQLPFSHYPENPIYDYAQAQRTDGSPIIYRKFLNDHQLIADIVASKFHQELFADLVGAMIMDDPNFIETALICSGISPDNFDKLPVSLRDRNFGPSLSSLPSVGPASGIYGYFREVRLYLGSKIWNSDGSRVSKLSIHDTLNQVLDSCVDHYFKHRNEFIQAIHSDFRLDQDSLVQGLIQSLRGLH